MRLIDADDLMDHAGRDRLDSRELIMQMIENAPTVKDPWYEKIKQEKMVLAQDNAALKERLRREMRMNDVLSNAIDFISVHVGE